MPAKVTKVNDYHVCLVDFRITNAIIRITSYNLKHRNTKTYLNTAGVTANGISSAIPMPNPVKSWYPITSFHVGLIPSLDSIKQPLPVIIVAITVTGRCSLLARTGS